MGSFNLRRTARACAASLVAALCLTAPARTASAQTLAKRGWAGSGMTVAPWWQSPVLYQIDPVSFQDSNGDGFGDLPGIVMRLDYLQGLGVDAIVLSPLQSGAASGRAEASQPFDPVYGRPEDLDQLVSEATRRKIRIFVDLPVGGTRTAAEIVNVARFWLSRGIAGLRLTLEPADLVSSALLADRVRELRKLCATYAGDRVLFWDVPQPPPGENRAADGAADRAADRAASDKAAMHSARSSRHRAAAVAAPTPDTVQMSLNAALERMPQLDAAALRRAVSGLPQPVAGHTTVLATDGADRPRSFDRFGSGSHDGELAKLLAAALLTTPGAPLLYFGQELGMDTTPNPASNQGSPGNPTPMQWGDAPGFTSGVPWMEMGRNTVTANEVMEDVDRYSLLNWYRRLTALHHSNAVLREGSAAMLNLADSAMVGWVRMPRALGGTASPLVVLCNFSDRPAVLSIAAELHRLNVNTGSGVMHTLATSDMPASANGDATAGKPDASYDAPVSINSISLPPYGVYMGELRRQAGLESTPPPVRSRSRPQSESRTSR